MSLRFVGQTTTFHQMVNLDFRSAIRLVQLDFRDLQQLLFDFHQCAFRYLNFNKEILLVLK